MLVPSKHRCTGNGSTSLNAEKNFSALLMPATSQPLTKSGLLDMAAMLAIFSGNSARLSSLSDFATLGRSVSGTVEAQVPGQSCLTGQVPRTKDFTCPVSVKAGVGDHRVAFGEIGPVLAIWS